MKTISIARDFTTTPGARGPDEGPFSGEEFLEKILDPQFVIARSTKEKLQVDLDGTEGYATSFLEASFGGLARKYGAAAVLELLELKAVDEPYLIEEIASYIRDTEQK